MTTNELRDILHERYPMMEVTAIRYEDLVFEERVRLKCLQCRNYQTKWTCPGKLPQIDFPKLIGEYEHHVVIRYQNSEIRGQKSEVRSQKLEEEYREAGNELHKAMLYLETEQMKRNNALAQSFIGGYCAWCEDGCPPDKCAQPEKARVSWDATGCNVMRSLANIGLRVDFTDRQTITRYGLFVW